MILPLSPAFPPANKTTPTKAKLAQKSKTLIGKNVTWLESSKSDTQVRFNITEDMSYCKILQSLKAVKSRFGIVWPFWNVIEVSVVMLPGDCKLLKVLW